MTMPEERSETETGNAVTRLQTSLVHAALMSKAIADTARRMRFSTRAHRVSFSGGFRARRGERAFRLGIVASFILVVVAPSLAATAYFGLMASPQYATEIRLTLGGGELTAGGSGAGFHGLPLMLVVQDTEIVEKYLQSPAIVEELANTTNLKAMYDKSNIDWVSRLRHDASMEDLRRYWRRKTSADIKMPGGIVDFTVRAFSPADAATLAAAALAASEKMVNDLNERMLHDTLRRATENLTEAANRLAAARVNLEQARNAEGMLSATAAAKAANELLMNVEAGRIGLQQEYDSKLRFLSPDEPQMRTARAQLRAADAQIADLKARMTTTDQSNDNVIAASLVKLSALDLDREIAETQYAMAATGLQQARIAAQSKLIYLNPFVMPMPGERPRFPTPTEEVLIIIVGALMLWGAGVAAAILVRNHMA